MKRAYLITSFYLNDISGYQKRLVKPEAYNGNEKKPKPPKINQNKQKLGLGQDSMHTISVLSQNRLGSRFWINETSQISEGYID